MAACNLKLGGEACHSAVRSCQGLWLSRRWTSWSFCWPRIRGIPIPWIGSHPGFWPRRSRGSIDLPIPSVPRSVAQITVISTLDAAVAKGGSELELESEGCPRAALHQFPLIVPWIVRSEYRWISRFTEYLISPDGYQFFSTLPFPFFLSLSSFLFRAPSLRGAKGKKKEGRIAWSGLLGRMKISVVPRSFLGLVGSLVNLRGSR